jgi:signal peptidase I
MPEIPRETLSEAPGPEATSSEAPSFDAPVTETAVPDSPLAARTAAGPPIKGLFRESIESLVVTLIMALFGITFLVQAFQIPSNSMEDTLLIGDHVMVDKVAYSPRDASAPVPLPYREIHRGDIVVFKYPMDPSMHLVKRVIGVPGDFVRIRHRQVFVNGAPLEEPFVRHKSGFHEEYRDEFPSWPVGPVFKSWVRELPLHVKGGWLAVPQGYYFVMGDNRDYSSDSRYWGFVPRENIVGRPVIIYWSVNSTSRDYELTGIANVKGVFQTLLNLPSKTRWERIFRTIHGVQR